MNRNEIFRILNKIKNDREFSFYKIGLAGSYARNEQNDGSDIDVVISTGNLTLSQMEKIKSEFPDLNVDVLQLDLLEEEDRELDGFLIEMGLPANDHSVYKNVLQEVMWA